MDKLHMMTACMATALGAAQPALAQSCKPPPAPPPQAARPKPPQSRPVIPACVDAATQISHCTKGEVERYNADIGAYNRQVGAFNDGSKAYVAELNRWVDAVNDYAQCELKAVNTGLPTP